MREQEFLRLKKEVDRLQREKDKADGAIDQLMKELEQFGCSSLEEAKQLLKKLEREERETERKFTKLFKRFNKRWKKHPEVVAGLLHRSRDS